MNPIEIISKREAIYQSIVDKEMDEVAKVKITKELERIQATKKTLEMYVTA